MVRAPRPVEFQVSSQVLSSSEPLALQEADERSPVLSPLFWPPVVLLWAAQAQAQEVLVPGVQARQLWALLARFLVGLKGWAPPALTLPV